MSRSQLLLYLIAFIVSAIVVVSLLVASFFQKSPTPAVINLAPSPSEFQRGIGSFPTLPPQASDSGGVNIHPNGTIKEQTITSQDQAQIDQDRAVGQLIKKLPFHAQLFNLRYDIDTNSFIVSFIKGQTTAATTAFNQFLKDNGIDSKDWLYNLQIKQLTY